ncbi:hypothetical protein CWE09_04980 [Aliidiomarina minuta]|uniref:YeeE/YedE family protein n=1 Tax=Aliidiomarina minuta TaxID=880057 RepID=A0A432W7V0_9GAMM|nr:DUF6691 family protein [Aliidiomarina minuta]RUO26081.1 hypothetical protein CWE09_04980 [Aliidiomarina minuta]
MPILIAFLCGLLMSAGIAVSQMIDPQKVLGFLNLAGDWDPSLALVMVGALIVYTLGYQLLKKRTKPVYEARFATPSSRLINKPLVVGAVIFGLGWGLVGYCPGPAIAALPSGSSGTLVFVAMMILGWFISRRLFIR